MEFEKRNAAGIVIYDTKTKSYLMGKRADGQGWGFAAGKSEMKDVDALATALRELKEELGITLTLEQKNRVKFVQKILCQYNKIDRSGNNLGIRHIFSNTFYLEVSGQDALSFNEQDRDDEVTEIRWLTMDDICSNELIFPPALIALNVCRTFNNLSKY